MNYVYRSYLYIIVLYTSVIIFGQMVDEALRRDIINHIVIDNHFLSRGKWLL